MQSRAIVPAARAPGGVSSPSARNVPLNVLEEGILRRTTEAHKTYQFNESHDPNLPTDHWFQESEDGKTLFLVLYTQACRWARCQACNLPSTQSAHHVPLENIMRQVDHTFGVILPEAQRADPDAKLENIGKVILSNNGSVLDEATFATGGLMYFIAKAKFHLPNLKTLSIETRPEYADISELEIISRMLAEGGNYKTQLENAIGFEAYDGTIRNDVFGKGLTLPVFEQFAQKVGKHGFRIKAYFMLKPVPGMSDEAAVDDIRAAFEYLDGVAKQHKVPINVHLNPTYVARGTPLEEAFLAGRYEPPTLERARQAVLHARGKQLSVFVGLSDEGLAVPGGSFLRPGSEKLKAQLERFNVTQDFQHLMIV